MTAKPSARAERELDKERQRGVPRARACLAHPREGGSFTTSSACPACLAVGRLSRAHTVARMLTVAFQSERGTPRWLSLTVAMGLACGAPVAACSVRPRALAQSADDACRSGRSGVVGRLVDTEGRYNAAAGWGKFRREPRRRPPDGKMSCPVLWHYRLPSRRGHRSCGGRLRHRPAHLVLRRHERIEAFFDSFTFEFSALSRLTSGPTWLPG